MKTIREGSEGGGSEVEGSENKGSKVKGTLARVEAVRLEGSAKLKGSEKIQNTNCNIH